MPILRMPDKSDQRRRTIDSRKSLSAAEEASMKFSVFFAAKNFFWLRTSVWRRGRRGEQNDFSSCLKNFAGSHNGRRWWWSRWKVEAVFFSPDLTFSFQHLGESLRSIMGPYFFAQDISQLKWSFCRLSFIRDYTLKSLRLKVIFFSQLPLYQSSTQTSSST